MGFGGFFGFFGFFCNSQLTEKVEEKFSMKTIINLTAFLLSDPGKETFPAPHLTIPFSIANKYNLNQHDEELTELKILLG